MKALLVLAGAVAVSLAASQAMAAESLEARLRAVEDRLAIQELMTGEYPRALDGRNWKAYAETFTPDGELVTGGNTIKGREAIEKNFSTPRPPPPPAPGQPPAPPRPAPAPGQITTMHVVTNLNFKIDGDRAVGGAYWETIGVRDGRSQVLGAGHYEDVLRKVNGAWKFQRRVIANDLPPRAAAAAPAPAAR
jgi:hypothetical protein